MGEVCVRSKRGAAPGWRGHVKRVHVVARGMVLGNIERLEIVVGSFHLRPGNHGIAERKKNPFDLLKRLPQRVPRAERTHHAGKREVFAFALERRLFGRSFHCHATQFERRFDVRLQFVEAPGRPRASAPASRA